MKIILNAAFYVAAFLTYSVGYSQSEELTVVKYTVTSGEAATANALFDNDVTTGWFPGWNPADYPAKIEIELSKPSYIDRIKFYDGVGKPILNVFVWDGNQYSIVHAGELGGYMVWSEKEINSAVKTSKVLVTISEIQGDIPLCEFKLYGKDAPSGNPGAELIVKKYAGDTRKFGTNGFHWVPSSDLIFTNLRIYQMYQWTWTSGGMMFEPSFQADANYDTYYATLKSLGVNSIPCINIIPNWLSNDGNRRLCNPIFSGDNPSDYIDVAKYAFQFAARYGKVKHPDSVLSINRTPRWNGDKINEYKSGLNLIRYVEFENEPDRPWQDIDHKYTPQQLAAMLSALWDGHEGTLGPNVGMKTADPGMKMVMPGLAEINVAYIAAMKQWFEANRSDKKFCVDVINVHHYSNISNPPYPSHSVNLVNGRGISPEEDGLELRLKNLVKFRNSNLPGKTEVWFSEFGYDTYPSTFVLSQYPKLYGNLTSEALQSMWLRRIFLLSLSSKVDKIFMYNAIDENSGESGGLFGSCGIQYAQYPTSKPSFGKKPSYHDLKQMIIDLNNYVFSGDKSQGNLKILEFRRGGFKKYFYWSGTANGGEILFKVGEKTFLATETPQFFAVRPLDLPFEVGEVIPIEH